MLKVLFSSWVDSLKIFLPKNFVPFFLVTLKSLKQLFEVLTQKNIILWFLLYCFGAIAITYLNINFKILLESLLWSSIIIILLAACRPSIDYKDNYYLFNKEKPLLIPVAIFIFITLQIKHYFLMGPVLIFWILFMLDSQVSVLDYIYAIARALKMLIYNFPFCFIVLVAIKFIIFAFCWLFGYGTVATTIGQLLFIIFLLPITCCLFANIYIKRLHEQFSIYYKQV